MCSVRELEFMVVVRVVVIIFGVKAKPAPLLVIRCEMTVRVNLIFVSFLAADCAAFACHISPLSLAA